MSALPAQQTNTLSQPHQHTDTLAPAAQKTKIASSAGQLSVDSGTTAQLSVIATSSVQQTIVHSHTSQQHVVDETSDQTTSASAKKTQAGRVAHRKLGLQSVRRDRTKSLILQGIIGRTQINNKVFEGLDNPGSDHKAEADLQKHLAST